MALADRARQVAHVVDDLVDRIKVVSWLTIVASLLAIAWFAADRDPPFEVTGYEELYARPGEYLTVRATVRRDADRQCHATLSRYIYADANQVRYSLGTEEHSAEEITMIEARSPGRMAPRIMIPAGIEPGPARYVTVISYRCNQVHALWPITVTSSIPFTVLP